MTNISKGKVTLCLLAVFGWLAPAQAAIESVQVNKTRSYEKAPGYTYAELTITGSVRRSDHSVGAYSVPAVMIYPRNRCGNDVGVVDWHNSAAFYFFPDTGETGTIDFTLAATGTHLFEEGYTYLSIQWDKLLTEKFGPTPPKDGNDHNHMVYGSIERAADAWEILLDAARLLKNPSKYPGKNRPARVDTVLSSGYSQGGALQLEMLIEGLDPKRVYDGHLVQAIGLGCWKRDDAAPNFGMLSDCGSLPTDGRHAPIMMLVSESDMVAYQELGLGKSAFFTRNRTNPNWRQYEMAGVSHIPEPIVTLGLPEPEQRGSAAVVPRRVRQPGALGARRQARQEAACIPLPGWLRRCERCFHSDQQGFRRPLRGRRALASCRIARSRTCRGRAARQSRAAEQVGARQRVRVPERDVRPLQRRRSARSLSDATRVREARQTRGRRTG